MYIKAIMAELAKGSVKTIITRGNKQTYPAGIADGKLGTLNLKPYVLVYDYYVDISFYRNDNMTDQIIVEPHFPPGFIEQLNNYVMYECFALLHRKTLTTEYNERFKVFGTGKITPMVEGNDDRTITGGNDDGTISRTRLFYVPRRWI